ncbi:hypothetical protein QQF64_024957 [Cirrhinus molitorella]|uniref:Reverse transcriptase n=1 Tax=Cirrhinus molitorella TaxID=172907 RepID=A0ABR3NN24_9TELE
MTIITTTKRCTRRLLQKLQENIQWARMQFKPSKSRSISIVKGKLTGERFYISEEPIPTVLEKPIKSLGRWYNADLKDMQQLEQIRQDLANGLKKINNTALPGKLNLWCYQFGLLPRLLWPLTMYKVSLSHANLMERLVNTYVRKWLGLPKCVSSVSLYSKGALLLPISSLVKEFKCAKVRLDMSLTESRDPTKASATERRTLVVEEVRRQEEALRCSKAVAQAKQGRWMRWEGLWLGKDPSCPLCTTPATLKHILVGCKTSLSQGRYTWRHNQVLKCLAHKLECKRVSTNSQPVSYQNEYRHELLFVREGDKQRVGPLKQDLSPLNAARDWQMRVDLDQRLIFPPEIAITTLRPDIVLWSNSCQLAYIIELTVPWEDAFEEAFERKKLRYSNLASEAEQKGWKIRVRPVEMRWLGWTLEEEELRRRRLTLEAEQLRQRRLTLEVEQLPRQRLTLEVEQLPRRLSLEAEQLRRRLTLEAEQLRRRLTWEELSQRRRLAQE